MATKTNTTHETLITGTSAADSIENTGHHVTISTGNGDDTVSNKYDSNYNVYSNDSTIYSASYVSINTGEGNDSYYGYYAHNCTINTGDGNDSVYNSWSHYCTINTGEGNDSVYNDYGWECTINTGAGNDLISLSSGGMCTINTGAGNDSVYNSGGICTINTGAGNDSVYNSGDMCTINTGAGNDLISLNDYSEENVIIYNSGDGNDKIYGFDGDDTLSISGGYYSTAKSGDNIIVTVGEGKITLVGAANLSEVNINGKKTSTPSTETNKWTLSGTTAKYGTSSKTLVTVKGIKSIDGLSVSKKVVTVNKSSLGTSKVTISNGYTLKLADDVPKPTTKKAAFSLSGSTATYKSSYKTAGYTLASDGKSISYTKATTAKSLATIKGAASKSGLSISGNKITLKKSALNKKVTVSGGYEFNFASDYKSAMISGSSNADSITANGSKLSINAGKGNDTIKALGANISVYGGAGADIFIYKAGKNGVITDYNTEDTISIAGGTAKVTTSGSDLIFTADNGKITVKGGKDKTVTYIDAGGKKTYKSSNDSKIITLTDDYDKETYTMGDKLRTVDASAVELDIKITGNKYINKIVGGVGNDTLIGGKSNDTLTGGNGSDIFVYNNGDGNDLITDYAEEDKISISGDKVSNIKSKGSDIIFTVGSGTITVVGGKDKLITYVDSKGEHIYPQIFTVKGKTITLTDEYTKKDFDVADYGDYKNINASSVEHGLNIVGNDSSNSITGTSDEDIIDGGANNDTIRGGNGNDSLIGGKGKDYLYGGEGNDTLWGGKGDDYLYGGEGSDIFIFDKSDGTDKIFDYEQGVDKIMILNGKVDNVSEIDGDVVFKVGTGTIVLNGAAGRYAEVLDGDRNILKQYFPKS